MSHPMCDTVPATDRTSLRNMRLMRVSTCSPLEETRKTEYQKSLQRMQPVAIPPITGHTIHDHRYQTHPQLRRGMGRLQLFSRVRESIGGPHVWNQPRLVQTAPRKLPYVTIFRCPNIVPSLASVRGRGNVCESETYLSDCAGGPIIHGETKDHQGGI